MVRRLRCCRGGGGGGGCVVEARSGALPPALCTCTSTGIRVRIMPHRALLQASVPSANGEHTNIVYALYYEHFSQLRGRTTGPLPEIPSTRESGCLRGSGTFQYSFIAGSCQSASSHLVSDEDGASDRLGRIAAPLRCIQGVTCGRRRRGHTARCLPSATAASPSTRTGTATCGGCSTTAALQAAPGPPPMGMAARSMQSW